MCSLGSPQIMLHGRIFDTIAQNVCRSADFQTFKKLCETILSPCNSKWLIFDFYLNRKRVVQYTQSDTVR